MSPRRVASRFILFISSYLHNFSDLPQFFVLCTRDSDDIDSLRIKLPSDYKMGTQRRRT
jgi:hypothetical protein